MWAETSLKVYYVLSDFILTKLMCNPLYGLQVPTDGIKMKMWSEIQNICFNKSEVLFR